MISLGLGAMLTLVQDEVQRSLSYAEARDQLSRDSDTTPIRIGLSEAEIDFPLSLDLSESEADIDSIKTLVESGLPVELTNLILTNPIHDLDLQMAIMDRLTIGNIEAAEEMHDALSKTTPNNIETESNRENQKLASNLNRVHIERTKMIQWEKLASEKHAEIKVTTPSSSQIESQGNAMLYCRVKLKFKVVAKD